MTGSSAQDLREVDAIVTGAKSSFFWAMRFLSEEKRQAMYALYAFCRVVDDIADGTGSAETKHRQLAEWDAEISAMYAARPATAPTRALYPALDRFGLPEEEFHELVAGMMMDAENKMIAPDAAALDLYCRRAAGTVGVLSLAIFGRSEEPARRFGLALADALQLTNILRDVDEDAGYGRLYLPRETLVAHQVPTTPAAAIAAPNLPLVCEVVADRAADLYRLADTHLDGLSRRHLGPALTMMAVYRRILDRLRQRGWRDRGPRLRLGKVEKSAIILRQMMASRS